MSRAEQVRTWLAQQDRPCSAAEIIAGIGMTGDVRAHYTIGVLYREGLLERTGQARGYLYRLGRPVTPKISRAEAKERRDAREKARVRHHGQKPWAEHVAMMKERSRKREAARAEERRRRIEASQRERAEAKQREEAERAAGAKRKRHPKPQPVAKHAPVKVQPTARLTPAAPPKPVLQQLESVADYIARGGHIERLPTSWEQAA